MIPLGQEQHLGHKAFILLFIRNVAPAFGLLFISILVTNMNQFIIQSVLQALNMSGQYTEGSIYTVATIFGYIVIILYILTVLLFILGYVISKLTYHFYTFTLEEFDLRLKRGILHLETVSIPYRQVQDVNINRSLFYRMLGLSRIIIDSAGHEEKEDLNETNIVLEPIDKNVAEEIRKLLQRKIGVQVIEKEAEADEDMKLGGYTNIK